MTNTGITAFTEPQKAYAFDEVFDSQKVFRLVLEASANPGRRVDLAPLAAKMFGESAGFLALSMTFLDNEQSFCTCGDESLAGQIASLTLSEKTGPEQADFIFVKTEAALAGAVEKAKGGTLKDPHKSATLIVALSHGLTEGTRTTLAGPGIDGALTLTLPETVRRALALRDDRFFEYPQGIDFWFLDPDHQLLALPRLVKREEH